ncbi:uncharacterized protein C16orf46 homolog isoform 1-T2 [Anableps anableps]
MKKDGRMSELQKMPERKYIDALLDISEESFMRDLEPYECHWYSGWEHAVQGWARVSPMSCIMINQKSPDKAKHKEDENPTALGLKQTPSKPGSPASPVERHWKSHADLLNFKEAGSLNQWQGSCGPATCPVHNATQKNLPASFPGGRMKRKCVPQETTCRPSSQYSLSEIRASKPQKHTIKHNVTMVPIKNFTFLPPINSIQKVSSHVCRGKNTSDPKTLYKLEKKIAVSQIRPASFNVPINFTSLTYSHQACQQDPCLFPAVSVSIPRRRQLSTSPKIDTMQPTKYSLDKNMSQAMVQPLVPAKGLLI